MLIAEIIHLNETNVSVVLAVHLKFSFEVDSCQRLHTGKPGFSNPVASHEVVMAAGLSGLEVGRK
jgi:hypothetical protein